MSKAQQLANDRPTSLNDDLYQWATDAEELLRTQDALLRQALEALNNSSDIVFKNTELAHLRASAVNVIQEHLE